MAERRFGWGDTSPPSPVQGSWDPPGRAEKYWTLSPTWQTPLLGSELQDVEEGVLVRKTEWLFRASVWAEGSVSKVAVVGNWEQDSLVLIEMRKKLQEGEVDFHWSSIQGNTGELLSHSAFSSGKAGLCPVLLIFGSTSRLSHPPNWDW